MVDGIQLRGDKDHDVLDDLKCARAVLELRYINCHLNVQQRKEDKNCLIHSDICGPMKVQSLSNA